MFNPYEGPFEPALIIDHHNTPNPHIELFLDPDDYQEWVTEERLSAFIGSLALITGAKASQNGRTVQLEHVSNEYISKIPYIASLLFCACFSYRLTHINVYKHTVERKKGIARDRWDPIHLSMALRGMYNPCTA